MQSRQDLIKKTTQVAKSLGVATLLLGAATSMSACGATQSTFTQNVVDKQYAHSTEKANISSTIKLMAIRSEKSPDFPILFSKNALTPNMLNFFQNRTGWIMASTQLGTEDHTQDWVIAFYDGFDDSKLEYLRIDRQTINTRRQDNLQKVINTFQGKFLDPEHAIRDAQVRTHGNASMRDVRVSILRGTDLGKVTSIPYNDLNLNLIELSPNIAINR